jgi:hypothetical protein
MGLAHSPSTVTDGLVLCLDAANPKGFSPNVFPKPTDIYAWVNSLTGNNSTLSRDTISSPVGTTPFKMAITGNDPHTPTYSSSIWNIAPTVAGNTWTISAFIKASVATTCELWLAEANSSGGYLQNVVGAYSNPSLTTEWQRFTVSGTVGNASTAFLQWRFDGPNTGGTGINIWIDGVQIERELSMTNFNPFYNQNGTNWTDLSGNNNGNSLVGAITYSNSVFNTNAINVTTESLLSTASQLTFPDASAYTFDFYVKLRSSAPATFHSLTGRQSTNPWLSIFPNDTSGASWYIRYRQGATYYNTVSINYNIQTNWANITVTADASRNVRFYLNGILQDTIAVPSTVFYVSVLGGGYLSSGNYYVLQGSISSVKMYTRTLTSEQIVDNFNALRGRFGI